MQITWIGQSGYILNHSQTTMVIDPYLSNSIEKLGFTRMIDPPVAANIITADYLVCTHDHGDHFDPESVLPIMQSNPGCRLLGPKSVINHAIDLGIANNRCLQLEKGKRTEVAGFIIKATHAIHSDPDSVGLIIHCSGLDIYISGDSEYSDELLHNIKSDVDKSPDIVMICINGKFKNMNTAEAVSLTMALHPRLAIPMHYGMFKENTIDPLPFINAVKKEGIQSRELPYGQSVNVNALLST